MAEIFTDLIEFADRIGEDTGQAIAGQPHVLVVSGREQGSAACLVDVRECREPTLAALVQEIEMQPHPAAGLRIESRGELRLQDHRPAIGIEAEAPEESRRQSRQR